MSILRARCGAGWLAQASFLLGATVLAQDPALTPLRRDVGVGTPSTVFDELMPYHHTFGDDGLGRFFFRRIVEPGQITPQGTQAPHGFILVDGRTEAADGEYLYVNFFNQADWKGKSSGIAGQGMPELRDIPFNMAFFSTSVPLPYGIEMVSLQKTATGGSGVSHMAALVKDPGRAELLDRNSRFGYRHSSVLTTPLRVAQQPADIIYRQRDATIEGVAKGILPAGDYGLATIVQYNVQDAGAGDHAIASSMQAWVIIGKVAAWREAVNGAYNAAEPWIAQQQPQADFRVLFKRPDGTYTVSGISGTARRFEFDGPRQQLTLNGGSAVATDEIFARDTLLTLNAATLTAPKITIGGRGATERVEVLTGGNLRADAGGGGELVVGPQNDGFLFIQPGGRVRAGKLIAGFFDDGGGAGGVADAPAAGNVLPENASVYVRVIEGNVHVGSEAYASNEALSVTDQAHVFGRNSLLECSHTLIDNTLGVEPVKIVAGQWTSQQTTVIGKVGLARALVLSGGVLDASDLTLGANAGGDGTLEIDGAGSECRSMVAGIGNFGKGRVEFKNVALGNLGAMALGQQPTGHGTVAVAGRSVLESLGLTVGRAGTGVVDVSDGSFLNTQTVTIGLLPGSNGTILVKGAESVLLTTLGEVGGGGNGLLDVSQGGLLQGVGGVMDIGGKGEGIVKVRGAGSLASDFGFNVGKNGRLEITEGAKLGGVASGIVCGTAGTVLISESPNNQLTTVIAGSPNFEVNLGSTLVVNETRIEPSGTLRLHGAGTALTVLGQVVLNGHLEVRDGAALIAGNAEARIGMGPNGHISGAGGLIQFPQEQIFNEFGIVAPGNSAGILTMDASYEQGAGGVLELEIGGVGPGITHDRFIVTGDVTLNGLVILRFVNGFVPQPGQQFELIDVGGAFAGTPTVLVQGLQPGWQFTAGFDPVGNSFQIVSQSAGTTAAPVAGGDLGDNDLDGRSHLLETALGTDPDVAGIEGLPTALIMTDPIDAKRYLHFTYRRALAASDVRFTVEVSDDLLDWHSGSEFVENYRPPALSADGKILSITERILPSLDDAHGIMPFVRLKVSR